MFQSSFVQSNPSQRIGEFKKTAAISSLNFDVYNSGIKSSSKREPMALKRQVVVYSGAQDKAFI